MTQAHGQTTSPEDVPDSTLQLEHVHRCRLIKCPLECC